MAKKTNEQKKAILELGKDGDFWKVICEFIEESKERVDEEKTSALEMLAEIPAEQFKVKLLVLEARKNLLDDLKDYPEHLISYLTKTPRNADQANYDPYFKANER